MQLHKRDVVHAATTLLDDYGIADLSMRRLARELAVSPGALYWHFANKQELLGAVADRILEPVTDAPGDWRSRIVGTCGQL
ncbi:MAG: helix-turn-helix domain-containing protein, partial [Actinomycetota bacterium]|nr:helix-turn-helix domain-containing protein [Actinomycetota bacterium]